ncbi:MAG: glycine cleavage system aminomethyltransferase GcvT, partial [Candidatus Acidiferrales bacterium]
MNSTHRRMGAKMVNFGGWDMPLEYTGILAEHQAVRTCA